jgi:branched-chain amino acid transport system ATP-binding protein
MVVDQMNPILTVVGVTKTFGKLTAVDDVSFEIRENEIFGVAGPNGAGKTTLFNVISGLPYHADAGRIEFRGEAVHAKPPNQICLLGLARTFQRETVFETLTVLENVLVGAVFGRLARDAKRAEEVSLEALEFVGLVHKAKQQAIHLPLFEKKLLMLASALATRPKLLLLDEPASGLNQPEMDRSAELFECINNQGIAIILIEHQLPLLLRVSRRVLILNSGQKLMEGSPEAVVKDERVIKAYLGQRGERGHQSS